MKKQKQETQRKIAMDAATLLPKIPVWLYRLLAIFPATGLFGVDHWAIGSKETGMAKALLNLLTFGSWYFFDIVQSFDSDKVSKDGLEIPFYGEAGIGQGNFGEGMANSFWIRILCMFGGFMIAAFAGAFVFKPNPVGGVAKAISGTAGAIAFGIAVTTIYSYFSSKIPTNLSAVSSLVLKGGANEAAPPTGPTFVELATLGTLASVTIAGFVLQKARSA